MSTTETTETTDATEGSDGSGRSRTVTIGRYMLHRQIARGGMATIHIARLLGDEGFSRIVAAKRLLPEFAEDTDFVSMFMDEARIASKVHHRNVVPVLDLVTTADEVMLVQEYVHGIPLHVLLRTAKQAKSHIPPRIAVSIVLQVAAGLHAAHETVDEMGVPLNIVHRDVSPQNVMVATDGTARLLDFGVAKATMAAHVTRDGTFKGKLAYSAPEQLKGQATRQSDVYSLSVVLWELLVGHRMHQTAQGEGELVNTILTGALPTVTDALSNEREWGSISDEHWAVLETLEPLVKKGLAVDLVERFPTALALEDALSKVGVATLSEVSAWSKQLGRDFLEGREKILAAEETSWRRTKPAARPTPTPGTRGSSAVRATPAAVAEAKAADEAKAAADAAKADASTESASDAKPGAKSPKPAKPARDAELGVLPPAPNQGRGKLVAVLGALVVLLGIGLVMAMNRGGTSSTAQRSTPAMDQGPGPGPNTGPANTATGLTPTETAAGGPNADGIAPTGTGVGTDRNTMQATGTTQAPGGTGAGTTGTTDTGGLTPKPPGDSQAVVAPAGTAAHLASPTAAETRKVTRERPRPTGRPARDPVVAKKPGKGETGAKPAPDATAGTADAKPATSCAPPYYFEGDKKIFKPECL